MLLLMLGLASTTLALVTGSAAERVQLTDWTVSSKFGKCKARVPGHALLDLGLGDPLEGLNEESYAKYSMETWTYETRVQRSSDDPARFQLLFEKLDTVATVTLNGIVLNNTFGQNSAQNTFLEHIFPSFREFSSRAALHIQVHIRSSLEVSRARASTVYNDKEYPHTINYNVWSEPTHRNTLRKPASDFGWDWGPSFPGPGIPGRVFLESGPPGWAFLRKGITVNQIFDVDGNVELKVTLRFRRLPGVASRPQSLVIQFQRETRIEDNLRANENEKTYVFTISRPRLWWPKGSRGFNGIRKVSGRLQGSFFEIYVNDELIDWRGTNVVPFDPFPSRLSWRELSARVVDSAIAMNTNAFRVWGGGSFPGDEFYEACDEAGLLIWQDLPWACAVFPATEQFLAEASRETEEIVLSLQSHASVVVWGGNNEVEASFEWFDATLASRKAYQVDYEALFLQTIGEVVKRVAGTSQLFVDSSPSNGLDADGKKLWGDVNDPNRGDVHFYNYSMDCENMDFYPKALFVSEHGVQSLPLSLQRYTNPRSIERVLLHRQRHANGFEEMEQQTHRMFVGHTGPLGRLEYNHRAILSQIVQGRCLSTAITAWRSHPRNHGIMLWQFNDVWPGISWSLMEYGGAWKVSAYLVRRAFRILRISLRRQGTDVVIYLQAFGELVGDIVFGYASITEFDWDGTTKKAPLLLFKVKIEQGEQEIGRIQTQMGLRLSGLGFRELDETSEVFILDEWIEPQGRFENCPPRDKSRHVTWFVQSHCELVVVGGNTPLPYVWLSSEYGEATGKFQDNGFLLLPHEHRRVRFDCFTKKQERRIDCNCSNVFRGLKVVTLLDLLGELRYTTE